MLGRYHMKRVFQIALLTLLICLCVLVITAFSTYLNVRVIDDPSRISNRISNLEGRMDELRALENRLENRSQYRVITYTNRVFLRETPASSKRGDVQLSLTDTNMQTAKLNAPRGKGDYFLLVSLTDCKPQSELQKFREFRVVIRDHDVCLDAIPKPGETISMEFSYTIFCEYR